MPRSKTKVPKIVKLSLTEDEAEQTAEALLWLSSYNSHDRPLLKIGANIQKQLKELKKCLKRKFKN